MNMREVVLDTFEWKCLYKEETVYYYGLLLHSASGKEDLHSLCVYILKKKYISEFHNKDLEVNMALVESLYWLCT